MTPRRWRVAALAAATVLLAACPATPSPAPVVGAGIPPAAAFDALARRRSAVRSLRARLDVTIATPSDRGSLDVALLLERPARLRSETLTVLGPTVVVVLDGPRLTACDLGATTCWRGPFPEAGSALTLPLPPLPAERIVDLLLASPDVGSPDAAAVTATDGVLRLDWRLPQGGTRGLVLDPRTGAPTDLWEHEADGRLALHVHWEGAEQAVPAAVRFETAAGGLVLDVAVERYEQDPLLPPAAFALDLPPGFRVEELVPRAGGRLDALRGLW